MLKKQSIYPYLLISPAILLIFLVTLYPTSYSVFLSFNRTRFGELEFIGLKNYRIMFGSEDFFESLFATLSYGLFFVSITFFISFLLAGFFNRSRSISVFSMTVFFIPWVLSEIVAGVVWKWMFLQNYGVLQKILGPLFNNFVFFANPAGAMGVVIAAASWQNIAYAMVLLLAGLQTIPSNIYDAAKIDGTNIFQTFTDITWPLIKNTAAVVIVLLTITSVNQIGMFLAVTEGGPGRSTEVLSLYMYREALVFFNFGYGSALSVTMFGLNALLIALFFKIMRRENSLGV